MSCLLARAKDFSPAANNRSDAISACLATSSNPKKLATLACRADKPPATNCSPPTKPFKIILKPLAPSDNKPIPTCSTRIAASSPLTSCCPLVNAAKTGEALSRTDLNASHAVTPISPMDCAKSLTVSYVIDSVFLTSSIVDASILPNWSLTQPIPSPISLNKVLSTPRLLPMICSALTTTADAPLSALNSPTTISH